MTRWLKTVQKGYQEKKKSGCGLIYCTPQLDLIVCTDSCRQKTESISPGPEWSSRTRIRTPPPGTEPAHPLVPPGYRSVCRTLKTQGRGSVYPPLILLLHRQMVWPQTHSKQFNVRAAHTLLHSRISRMAPLVVNKNSKSPTFPLATLTVIAVCPNSLKAVHSCI